MKSTKLWSLYPLIAGLLLVGALKSASSQETAKNTACLHGGLCQLGDRGYHLKIPAKWDKKTPLPVLLHFHGWGRQGSLIIRHQRIAKATQKHGVLLIAPNGLHGSWDFWHDQSADVPFATKILEDVATKVPIDKNRIYVSGYSYGSAMAWRFACLEGRKVAALLAISGTLRDQKLNCPGGPVHVRHVHGTSDTVMDYPFGPNGSLTYPVKLWRTMNNCNDSSQERQSWSVTNYTIFDRRRWKNCNSGKDVILDIHKRGHYIPVGWIDRQLDELGKF